ncbi:putative ribonuclease H-like domain-containing protein [Tanacetum coccineum]|uniref:Ribonuclease H-like domain-containing protein n=1 Tax=Tanacetum coccineum TaxID=301880 RepID=A0ABQ5AVR3_9ASTR
MPELEDIICSDDDEDVGAEAGINNLDAFMPVNPIPTIRIHKDHLDQIIGDLNSAPQTRRMTKNLKEHGLFSSVQQRINHKRLSILFFACFLSQEEPKKMDVKSAFFYGKIEEEVYVCQPPGFEDPNFPDRVYKVEKALYGLHQAPRAWYETLLTYLLDNGFQRGNINKTLFIRRTKIYIDNESTSCIVKNPVFHSKTKHIKIRHHFIRDSNEKKLIQMIKIHTDQNVADLLTKTFDVSRLQYLIARIGVNAGNSKLMLLGINLLLLEKVNAARHNLLLMVLKVNAVRHNLQLLMNVNAVEVAFLEKPTESEGFDEIVDFLNANPIKYALTVNPTIYCSYVKELWDTVKAKTVNGEV